MRPVAAPFVPGLDVGGTKILRSGLVDRDGNVMSDRVLSSLGGAGLVAYEVLDGAR